MLVKYKKCATGSKLTNKKLFFVGFYALSVVVIVFGLFSFWEDVFFSSDLSKFSITMLGFVMFGFCLQFVFNMFVFKKFFDIYINVLYVKHQGLGTYILSPLSEVPKGRIEYLYIAFLAFNIFFITALPFVHSLVTVIDPVFEVMSFRNWMFIMSVQIVLTVVFTVFTKRKIFN